jgi:predicted nucleotidyltransferase
MDPAADVLFGKTRQAVLAALFERGAEGVYLRELERLTGISSGPLHHELQRLMHADLVEKSADGNRVIYRVNQSHPVHAELRGIVEKTCGLPAQVRDALQAFESRIQFAAIFGSTARGSSHGASDVDLLVVGDISPTEIIDRIQALEERLEREVGFRVYSRREFNERQESDPFLSRVLERPMITLFGSVDDA